jgi:hypothetical protein
LYSNFCQGKYTSKLAQMALAIILGKPHFDSFLRPLALPFSAFYLVATSSFIES